MTTDTEGSAPPDKGAQGQGPAEARKPTNLAMVATWFRMAMIPMIVLVLMIPDSLVPMPILNKIACVIFVLASVTDAIDGYLARNHGFATPMGAFLDPVADKLIVSAAVIMLLYLGRMHVLVALVIVGRELAVSALREWMARIGESGRTKVNRFGKTKTAAQMVAIGFLLWFDPWWIIPTELVGQILSWVAAVLTVYSMCTYIYAAGPYLTRDTAGQKRRRRWGRRVRRKGTPDADRDLTREKGQE